MIVGGIIYGMVDWRRSGFHLPTGLNHHGDERRVPQKREALEQDLDGRVRHPRHLRPAGSVDVLTGSDPVKEK